VERDKSETDREREPMGRPNREIFRIRFMVSKLAVVGIMLEFDLISAVLAYSLSRPGVLAEENSF